MVENSTINILIQGGLATVALALIYVIYVVSKYYFNHTNETIQRNTDAFQQHSTTFQKLSDVIDNNTKVIEKYHNHKKR